MSPAPFPGDSTPVFAHPQTTLLSEQDVTTAVHHLAQGAHRMIPTAAGAGVSLLGIGGSWLSIAATDPAVEAAQYALGLGPCLSAWVTQVSQCIENTATETRWAGWVAAAVDAGICSMLSVPLTHHGHALGTLKVHATVPGAFGKAEEQLLGSFAQVAATLIGGTQLLEVPVPLGAALQDPLTDRETIGLATTVLMAREHWELEAARSALSERARVQGHHVVEVAAEILDDAVGSEQARRLGAAMVAGDIDRGRLHLYHYGIGGAVNELEVDAYLHHALSLPRLQRDLLAVAANEILDDTAPPRAPYATEILADRMDSAKDGDRENNAFSAVDTEPTDPDTPGPPQK